MTNFKDKIDPEKLPRHSVVAAGLLNCFHKVQIISLRQALQVADGIKPDVVLIHRRDLVFYGLQ